MEGAASVQWAGCCYPLSGPRYAQQAAHARSYGGARHFLLGSCGLT